jgi:hypothetical protein
MTVNLDSLPCDAPVRNRQRRPIRRTFLRERTLVLGQVRFDAFGDAQDVPTNRRGVEAGGHGQDIGQKFGRGRVRDERGPARLQIKPLRRDVIGNEFPQRGFRDVSSPFLAWAAAESWARQSRVAKQGVK